MKQKNPKKVRLKDIAARADLSIAAVSMALANRPDVSLQTKRRVRQLSEQMGYRRATPLAPAARSGGDGVVRIGVLGVAGRFDEHDHVHVHLLRRFARKTAERSERLEIADIAVSEDEQAMVSRCVAFAQGLQGLILCGWIKPTMVQAIQQTGIPCVILGYVMADPGGIGAKIGHVVSSDNIAEGYLATRSLIDAGHRRIAFTCELAPRGLSHWRWNIGYKLAHVYAGLPVDPDLVTITGRRFSGARAAVEQYRRLDAPPSAHVVPEAQIAKSLIEAYRTCGQELDRQNIVIGTTPDTARNFGFENYPLVSYDAESLVTATFHRLHEIAAAAPSHPTELLIPSVASNLPEPCGQEAKH